MKPYRADNFGTYLISTQTAARERLFIFGPYALLLIDCIYS